MPWTDVQPFAALGNNVPASDASVTVTRAGRFRQRVRITLREAPPWWKPGECVRVQFGTGEDAGRLRITPRGPHKIGKVGGRTARASLSLPLFPQVSLPGGMKRCPVTFDYADVWIEIDLPPTLRPQAAQTAIGGAAPSTRPNGTPFRTAATRDANRWASA